MFDKFIKNAPTIVDGKKLIESAKSYAYNVASKTSIFSQLKKLFSPSYWPKIHFPIGIKSIFPPTVWNTYIKKVLQIKGRLSNYFPVNVLQPPKSVVIDNLVFGVPPSYLLPKTLAGKTYLPEPDKLFRYFIIKDVGKIALSTESPNQVWKFEFKSAWSKAYSDENSDYVFKDILERLLQEANINVNTSQYTVPDMPTPIKFALDNDEFAFNFSNSYGDTFLQQLNNIVSNTARQLLYISPYGNLGQTIDHFQRVLQQLSNESQGASKALLSMLNNIITSTRNLASSVANKAPTLGTLFGNLAQGKRIVFPKIWQGSSFSNSYTIRTTLYALSDDPDEIKKRILLPLAILLIISTPIASDEYFYQYPFVIQAEIEGVRDLPAAVITDLRINLGGERSFYDIDKKYLAIDIEFNVMDVYDVMVTSLTDSSSIVPTTTKWFKYLSKYINK